LLIINDGLGEIENSLLLELLTDSSDTCAQANLNAWDFDIFYVKSLSNNSPLRYVAVQMFKDHSLFKKFGVS